MIGSFEVTHATGRYAVRVEQAYTDLGAAARAAVPQARRAVVVSNPHVAHLYLGPVSESLRAAGLAVETLLVPDGEGAKITAVWSWLLDGLLRLGVDRSTPVLALGGGVVGDLAGFAAATALRGLPLIQVPTTLLAMVDSAVGGKTGINSPRGKNLIGAFHAPALVFANVSALSTLPAAELRGGLAEAIKHALLFDGALFEACEAEVASLRRGDPAWMQRLVLRSAALKAAVVAEDEREHGARALLNFGHTVGHAIEAAVGYGGLRHGECVAIGMVAELRFAEARGLSPAGLATRLAALLAALEFPALPVGLSAAALLAAGRADKKRQGGSLPFAVIDVPGQSRLASISEDSLPDLLASLPGLLED